MTETAKSAANGQGSKANGQGSKKGDVLITMRGLRIEG